VGRGGGGEGGSRSTEGFNAVNLDQYREHGHIEGEEGDAVDRQDQRSEETEFLETSDLTGGTDKKDEHLDGIVTDNGLAHLFHGIEDDLAGRFNHGRRGCGGAGGGVEELGVREDGACNLERLVKADGDDEEREGLGKADGVEGNGKIEGHREGEDEGGDRRGKHGGREPQVGSELATCKEESDEGSMHKDVSE